MRMIEMVREHLEKELIPFWKGLRDDTYGGYYGFLSYDLDLDKEAEKGCILNSRILWFFSSAYTLCKDKSLLDEARHAYEFMIKHCIDKTYGGIYWSMTYDGRVLDSTKHTYNQAFAIYALSAYYEASGDMGALTLARNLFSLIENKCKDIIGYKEASNEKFEEAENDKLSENGVIASRTMNTLLHVLEAYTELYRVGGDKKVREALEQILTIFAEKVYNKELHRQEVFFDNDYKSLIDLHSYGHDIETSWLVDRAVEVIDEDGSWARKITPITKDLSRQVYEVAFDGRSLAYECDRGLVNEGRVWWVQAETVVGFINAYEKSDPKDEKYLDAAKNVLDFIFEYLVDKREGSEWFWEVSKDGKPDEKLPIVEPWKCPYHNGRMCIELIKNNIIF
jgi:mannobiose 2-epimerase